MRTVFFLTIIFALASLTTGQHAHSEDIPLQTEEAPPHIEVTSDSPEYCEQLDRAIQYRIHLPHGIPVGNMHDAQSLQFQGESLCSQKQIRAGIARLRRALLLLKTDEGFH